MSACYFCKKEAILFDGGKGYCKTHSQPRICPSCGENFYSALKNKYCGGGGCSTRLRKVPEIFSKCQTCGTMFYAHHSNKKYCSNCGQSYKVARSRFIILERDNFKCFYCGYSSYGDGKIFHIDHIFPKVLGGKDIAGNLVTACQDCNVGKGYQKLRNTEALLSEIKRRNSLLGISDDQIILFQGVRPGGKRA